MGPLPDSVSPSLNPLQALDNLDPTTTTFSGTLSELQEICASRSVLPSSHVLSNDQLIIEEEPFAFGGYSDVYKGTLSNLGVCVKGLRVDSADKARKGTNRCNSWWPATLYL